MSATMRKTHMPLPSIDAPVRNARMEDIPSIVELLNQQWSHSEYADTPLDPMVARRDLRLAIKSKNNHCQVYLSGGEAKGVCVGAIHEVFGSRSRGATTVILYVCPSHAGHGIKLLSGYLRWARKGVVVDQISVGVTSGLGDQERVEKLLAAFGFLKYGTAWKLKR